MKGHHFLPYTVGQCVAKLSQVGLIHPKNPLSEADTSKAGVYLHNHTNHSDGISNE